MLERNNTGNAIFMLRILSAVAIMDLDENPTPLHAVPVRSSPLTLSYCLDDKRLLFPQVLHYQSMGLNSSISVNGRLCFKPNEN
jgi:hypothetical protein